MSELIDILKPNGKKTGEIIDREDLHSKGKWHKAIHVWIINEKKEILMQQRSPNKINYPNKWDVSSGGHVSSGDNSFDTAIREVKEKLGLKINKKNLKYLFTTKEKKILNNKTYLDNEIIDVFIYRDNIKKIKIQKAELSDYKLINLKQFKKIIQTPTCVPHKEEYLRLINILENIFKEPIFIGTLKIDLGWISFSLTSKGFLYIKMVYKTKKKALEEIKKTIDKNIFEIKDNTKLTNKYSVILKNIYNRNKNNNNILLIDRRYWSDFQRSVYTYLQNIKTTISYKDLAIGINKPKSYRAIGQALAKNPLPIITPCHLVLSSQGTLHGFSVNGGIKIKINLLKKIHLT